MNETTNDGAVRRARSAPQAQNRRFGRRHVQNAADALEAAIGNTVVGGQPVKTVYKLWEKTLIGIGLFFVVTSFALLAGGISLVDLYLGKDQSVSTEPIGSIGEITGRIKRKSLQGLSFFDIKNGEVIHSGDTIVSDVASTAVVSMNDGSTVKISPSTMIRLDAESGGLSFAGLKRKTNVDVISGQVSGKANENELLLRQQGKELRLGSGESGAQESKSFGSAAETKVFNQAAPGNEPPRILVVYPEDQAFLRLSTLLHNTLPLRWNIIPADPKNRVQVVLKRLGKQEKEILSQYVEQKEVSQSVNALIQEPGDYEWSVMIIDEDSAPVFQKKSRFQVLDNSSRLR